MIRLLASLLLAGLSSAVLAQTYPDRPVHVYVGYAAGSGPDIQARTVSQALSIALRQSFVVENRTGANGTLAARVVAQTTLLDSAAVGG
jgi:tripartite-type tricarboxylate transporter receptor subunit TctC